MRKPNLYFTKTFMYFMVRTFLLLGLFCVTFKVSAQQSVRQQGKELLYFTGQELIEKQLFAAAIQQFGHYLKQDGNLLHKPEALYYQAWSSLNLGHPDAVELYRSFQETYPSHLLANRVAIDLGRYYYKNRAYDKTIKYLRIANLNSLNKIETAETRFMLAYSYLSRKDFKRADSLFSVVKGEQHSYTAAANYYSAYLSIRKGQYEQAGSSLDKAEKDPVYKPVTGQIRVIIFYKQKQYDKAIEAGEKALKDSSRLVSTDEIVLLIAESHYNKQRYQEASQRFNEYIKLHPGILPIGLQYRIAWCHFKNKETDQAIEGFKTIAANPDSIAHKNDSLIQYSAYYLGVCHVEKGQGNFALPAFDQARKIQANRNVQEMAWFNYGKVNYDLGKFADAIDAFRTYQVKFPDAPNEAEANELMSEAFLNTSDYDQALKHIATLKKRSKRVDAAYQRVTFLKGTQLYNDNQFQEAIAFFESSLKYPLDSNVTTAAHFWAAEALSVGKKYPEAQAHYESLFKGQGFKESDYYIRALYGYGYSLFNSANYDKALPLFAEYVSKLEKAPNQFYLSDAIVRLADCHYTRKSYTEALDFYTKAIDLKVPDSDYCWYQKGLVQILSNKPDEAKKSFDAVITQFPDSRFKDEALFQKAQADFEKGNYAAAVEAFAGLIQSSNNKNILAYSYLKRALAYVNLKKTDEAIADFKKILDVFPAHKVANSALLGLQEALTNAGNSDQFNEYLAKYKAANPDDKSIESVEYETSKNLFFGQKYEKAIQGFEEYLRKYPDNILSTEARFFLAESYYRTTNRPKALELHKQVVTENKSSQVNKSVARIAELELAEGRFNEAKRWYQVLITLARNKKEALNGQVGLMECYYLASKYDSVAFLANDILARPNAGVEAQNKASLYLGKVDFANGNAEKAMDEFIATLNAAKDQNGAEAQYLMAEILNKQGRYKQSVETLFDLNRNFAAYPKWVDKSFLLLSENYLALGDSYNARYALERLIEKASTKDTREQAKIKLQGLKDKKIK